MDITAMVADEVREAARPVRGVKLVVGGAEGGEKRAHRIG